MSTGVKRMKGGATWVVIATFCGLALFPEHKGWADETSDAPGEVHLELVLAIDASTSVSDEEFLLQRDGLSAAFRDERVIEAVEQTGPGGVAVAVVQWSNAHHQVLAVDWTRLGNETDCFSFAVKLSAMERQLVGGTVISGALDFARRQILENAFKGDRGVIDLSGDGPDRHALEPARARDRAVAAGITVNALAVLTGKYKLDDYLRNNVIGGPGAFVISATGYGDFAAAMRQKLIKEITSPAVARVFRPNNRPGISVAAGDAAL